MEELTPNRKIRKLKRDVDYLLSTSPYKVYTAYQTADATYTNDATLNNTDLSITVASAGIYKFSADVFVLVGAGGMTVDFDGGSATFNDIKYSYHSYVDGIVSEQVFTDFSTDFSFDNASGFGLTHVLFYGYCNVNAGGTIIMRSAQTGSNADPSTLYKGSNIILTKMN